MRTAPGQDGWEYGRSWLGVRLPAYLQAPHEPLVAAPLVRQGATPQQFARRVIFAVPRYVVPGGLLLALNGVGDASMPIIAGTAIDDAIGAQNLPRLGWWLALLAVMSLVGHLSYRFGSRMGLFGMQTVQHGLRTQVTDRLLDPRGIKHGHVDGAALSIATADVAHLAEAIRLLIYPVGAVVSLGFAVIALTLMAWPLGLTALAGVVILPLVVIRGGRRLQQRVLEQQDLAGDSVGTAADLLAGYRVIKGVRAEGEAARRYRVTSRDALGGTLRARRAEGAFITFTDLGGGLFTTALVVLIGVLALRGDLSVGQLISAVGLVQVVAAALGALGENVGAIWAEACACAQRVLSVLQAPTVRGESSGGRSGDGSSGGVGKSAPVGGGDAGEVFTQAALHACVGDVDVAAKPGECVGVDVDQRTAGQLVRALAVRAEGRDDPWMGEGDATVQPDDVGLDVWRRHVLVAPHRAELFDGSVRWNLSVPGALSNPDGLEAALHAAACDDVVDALEDGLDTEIGEGGYRLSAGQRQRLALARAYAAQPDVLVLHDPTTAVDAATENLVAQRLRPTRSGRTTVVVTSSPALLSVCDRVIRADGRSGSGSGLVSGGTEDDA